MYQYSSRFTLTAISNVKEVENVVVHIQSFITWESEVPIVVHVVLLSIFM